MPRGSTGKSPNMARGAKSRANLKRGGNHPRPKTNEDKAREKEVARIARKLLNPTYLKNLRDRLLTGKIQPGVEVAIWQYAFGKPKEIIETTPPIPIRITHEYTE